MGTKLSIQTVSGQQEVDLTVQDYRAAGSEGLSFSQYVNRKYQTPEAAGTAFQQMMASSGLLMSESREFGYRPPTMKSIFDGSAALAGASVVRPDGSQSDTPAGRLLYPAVIIDLLSDVLYENKSAYNAAFLGMIAQTHSITSPRYDVLKIDSSVPRGARGQVISQLAEPARMLSITTSGVQRAIPKYSIGMQISDEAAAAATLDYIGLALQAHTIEDRSAQYMDDLYNLTFGSVDTGDTALSSVTATSYDASLSNTAGALSQRAWIKFLRQNWRRRTITDVVCDIDAYLSIEGRTGRITSVNQTANDERLNPIPQVVLPGIPNGVNIFITDGVQNVGNSVLGANVLLGLDRSKAMRRIVFTGAEYRAVEEFVMSRSTSIRIDWAERIERAGYDEAFQVMTLT